MWFNLGNAGGGAVWGKDFTAPECYQQSLDADPTSPNAWCVSASLNKVFVAHNLLRVVVEVGLFRST